MSMHEPLPGPGVGPADAAAPQWQRALCRSIAQGHHVVLHGGVNDLVPWDGRYRHLPEVLQQLLRSVGYEAVAFYDPIDGMAFAAPSDRDAFEALTDDGSPESEDPMSCLPDGAEDDGRERVRRARDQQRALREALGTGRASLRDPRDALAATRRALSQNETPVAVVMRYSDLMLQDPATPDRVEREIVMWVKSAGHAARLVGPAGAGQLRNVLVLVAEDLDQVPQWIHRRDPLFATVQVQAPDQRARKVFLDQHLDHFYGVEGLTEDDRAETIRQLADLTDGMWHWDLDALRRTSVAERIPVDAARRLTLMYRYGERDDPYEQLTMTRIREIGGGLRDRVIGQDHAVQALLRMLGRARLRLGSDPDAPATRPRGVFFFVGPTGVGKTELARALAEALFGDDGALAQFDMSNYREEHARIRLVGAPPSFVGFEQGGELTNRVIERPHSVILFDEIEKAHRSVFDLLLQVLDAGRLTDGRGQDANFGESILIFTSNIGSDQLYGRIHGVDDLPDFEEVEDLYQRSVKAHFLELGRPELLGRLGKGIIPFDVLRESSMDDIARKELDRSLAALRRERPVEVDWPPVLLAIRSAMSEPDNLALGGRAIVSLIRQQIEGGLADWWLEHEPAAGVGLRVSATPRGQFTFESQ